MQWNKVKKILTVILLAVNAFLLLNLGIRYMHKTQREAETLQNISLLLKKKGIILGENFKIPQNVSLPILNIDRNRAAEEETAKKMLGADFLQSEDAEGNVTFENNKSWITWGADGTVQGIYEPERTNSIAEEEIEKAAKALFQTWGIAEKGSMIETTGRMATITSSVASMPVHNRYIALYFEEEGNIQISGFWSFSIPYTTAQESGVLCAVEDAILTFASEEQDIGMIQSITLGYFLKQENGRKLQLVPTWNIGTDTGQYYIECASKTMF